MTQVREHDADVIVVGGGSAGSALGGLLARDGTKTLIVEKDIHPRGVEGDSCSPSTNLVFDRLDVIDKLNDAGFVHRTGTGWNGTGSPLWTFDEMSVSAVAVEGTTQSFTYNLEFDELDTILLRHAHEMGAKVLQGVTARNVIYDDGRAVGIRAQVSDGWERDLFAKVIVDASGRRGVLASGSHGTEKRSRSNRFSLHSWFESVKAPPERYGGFTLFYRLGLVRGAAWQIPLRKGRSSIGVVLDERDFERPGENTEEFFDALIRRNPTSADAMKDARRVRPFRLEDEQASMVDRFSGLGWMLVGDALGFVDPVFSSGVDLSLFSSLLAHETITEALRTGGEAELFERYQSRIATGVGVRHELISMFSLPDVITRYAATPHGWEGVARALRGDPYQPETQDRARAVLEDVRASSEETTANPGMDPGTPTRSTATT